MSSKTKEESLGTVSKNRAIMIFEALGFKTANKWDVVRLQKKLTKLHTLIEGADLDDKTQKRVNEILRAQNKGRKVVVVDPEDAAASKQRTKAVADAAKREVTRKAEKKAMASKKQAGAAKKKAKEDAAAKKQEKRISAKKAGKKTSKKTAKKAVAKNVETDKFGSRKGSNVAKINAVLSKKAKKMSVLVKEAKLSGTHYEHLGRLIEAGYVKKSEKGYSLS